MHIVCHDCETINRVPEQRLGDKPCCARCKNPLLPAHTFALSDSNFNRFITQTQIPIVVDFWANWCGPCKVMAPQYELAAKEMPGLLFAKVDTEQNPKIGHAYSIRSIPTLLVLQHGKVIAKQAGAMSANDIVTWVNRALGAKTS